MKVLVTGASGYIGTQLISELLAHQAVVVGIDWKTPRIPGYNHYQVDVRDSAGISKVIEQCAPDAVVHLAALRVPACDHSPRDAVDTNYGGTVNVVKAAQEQGVPQVIFASSCSVYGFPDHNNALSESDEIEPVSAYSVSKAMAEEWITNNSVSDTSVACLRFATAFGCAQFVRNDLMVNSFVSQAVAGTEVKIFQPAAWRPFCHVKDLVKSCMLILLLDKSCSGIYNVGSNTENYTKQQVWECVHKHVPNAQMVLEMGVADPRNYKVNFDKFYKTLGFVPDHSMEDGVKELVRYYNS